MKRFFVLCIVCVAFATAPAFSADLQKGFEAFDRDDYKTAVSELRPFAEQGHSVAQYALGWMYQKGKGVLQDYKESVKWYRLSAEQGDQFAQNNLGVSYEHGRGVAQDYVLSHMWYNIATSNDSEKAPKNRDDIAEKMTSTQIDKAQDLARECLARDYKGC